jgi:hypothetical protein
MATLYVVQDKLFVITLVFVLPLTISIPAAKVHVGSGDLPYFLQKTPSVCYYVVMFAVQPCQCWYCPVCYQVGHNWSDQKITSPSACG